MRIYWQVEENGGYKQSLTRREPKKNMMRLLDGKKWEEAECKFEGQKVLENTGGGKKEVTVIAGPNYNIPRESKRNFLIINILWEDPTAQKEDSKEKLKKIADTDFDANNMSVGKCLQELIKSAVPGTYKSNEDYRKIIDLIYIPGTLFAEVYKQKDASGKMNLGTLIKKIYAIKDNKKGQDTDDLDKLLEKHINEIKILF